MEIDKFKAMVARLEADSAVSPQAYRLKVGALALLGFGILALLLGTVGLGIVLLVALVLAVALSGGTALLLLLKFGKLLFFIAVPMFYLVKHGVQALFVRVPPPDGEPLTRAQAPALFAALDDMRRRMKGPAVHHVRVVDEVNAAVVQRPAFGLVGFPRNYLLLGLPLLESMPPDEALAVVAHEYGHLAGSHGRFGAWIYRLRHSWGTIQAFTEQMQGWLAALVRPLVRWYAPYFNAYTFVLARSNEYEADAASAELVGPAAASNALKRVNLVGSHYQHFIGRTFDRMRDDERPPADLSQRWAEQAVRPADSGDAQRWLAEALDREGDVADTHPVLRQRLMALAPAADLQALPPAPAGPSAAEAWLGPVLAGLRSGFEAAWAERVADGWAERHAQMQQDRKRLDELRALPERDTDQAFEMLRLQTGVDVAVDQREAWAAFNAAQPDHAAGLYFEGAERLYHDDAAGAPLLERAMALDAELIKPACDRLFTWLMKHKRGDEAERVAARWRDRDDWENRRMHELEQFDVRHALVAADGATCQAVRALLTDAALRQVATVQFARRVLPTDATTHTYVLAFTLTAWGRLLSRQQKVLQRLAAIEWPVHLFVCSLHGSPYGKLRKPLKAVKGSRLV